MSDKLPELMKKLQDADPNVRDSALDQIGTLAPANALNLIVPFLSDENVSVRETAACNLGEIKDKEAIPHLIKTIRQEPDQKVRFYAINALSAYHSPEILDCLVGEVYRGELSIMAKQTVAEQLGNYEGQKAVDALVTLLADSDPYVLVPTVDSLLKLNQPRLQNIWQDILLNSYHFHLAQTALQALTELKQAEPFDLSLSFVASDKADVRKGAVFALSCLDDERVIPHLIELASHDPAESVRDMAILGLTEYTSAEIHRYFIFAISHQPLSAFARELIAEELSLDSPEADADAAAILLKNKNEIMGTTVNYLPSHLNGTGLQTIPDPRTLDMVPMG